MTNEIIFIGIALLNLCLVLVAWRIGKEFLIATILANFTLVVIFAGKLVPLFGLIVPAGEPFYVAIFIATDILSEHHGKKIAYRSIWMGFLVTAVITVMSQIILQWSTLADTAEIAAAMDTVFAVVPRFAIAGFIAYVTAQSFDIWLFHAIRRKTGWHLLWFRNNASTLTSLLLDTCVYFPLAYFGTVSLETLGILMLTGWIFKAPVALLDTPFIYLSYIVVGKQPPDIGRFRSLENESPATGL